MQKWDYLAVVMWNDKVKSARINGAAFTIPNKPFLGAAEMSQFLTYVGEEGWELITMNYPTMMIFKRPRL